MKTALLVEDNDLNHLLFSEVLRHAGFDVISDRTGAGALRLAGAGAGKPRQTISDSDVAIIERRRPDIAVIDLALPTCSGLEVIRALRADLATATIPIIAVSAFARTADGLSALNAGADVFFCKPVDMTRLSNALDQLTTSQAA
ncbi:MAG: response regulator [Pseudomonadota bacterium]